MKRKMTAVFLAAAISLSGMTAADTYMAQAAEAGKAADAAKEAAMAEADAQAADTESTEYADLSDSVIQEGGFLKQSDSLDEGIRVLADAGSTQKTQVQKALTDAWDALSRSCDLTSYKLTEEELRKIYSGTLNQYPKYFYVSSGYEYWTALDGTVSEIRIQYTMEEAEIPDIAAEYENVVSKVTDHADASWSDMEKILYINDYLARNCAYDETRQKYNAYDALVGRSAVCQGYALAFRELAQRLKLKCELVSSKSLNHAWNLAEVNGFWYHVDVTWNDPVPDRIGQACHYYFMKSTDYVKNIGGKEHFAEDDWVVTGGISQAAAADTSYDYYFWNNVNAGFEYIDGNWYGFNGADCINRFTCSGETFSSAETVSVVHDIWHVIDSNRYWIQKYVAVSALNGKLYFSGEKDIYELDVKTKTKNSVFTLTQDQQSSRRIYGMDIDPSGEIRYALSASPKEQGTVYTLESAADSAVFDGNSADSGKIMGRKTGTALIKAP